VVLSTTLVLAYNCRIRRFTQTLATAGMPAVANVCVLGLRMREKIVGNCFFDAFVLLGIDDE